MIHNFITKFIDWLFIFCVKYRSFTFKTRTKVGSTQFCGHNKIYPGAKVKFSTIGFGSYISSNCNLPRMECGKYCSIGPEVKLICGNHPSKGFISTHPAFFSILKQNGYTFVNHQKFAERKFVSDSLTSVKIGNDVWIGYGVSIFEGVSIGDGAIIGANALVINDIPPYSICVGSPAKIVKYRFSIDQINTLTMTPWWNMSNEWITENAHCFSEANKFFDILKALGPKPE